MAAKTWRLIVTDLGGSSALHEVTVEAANWMAALTVGRTEIGEAGGMPTGASCAVAPDGKVTLHDPVARRTYALTPDVAQSFTRNKASGPRIPVDEAAAPAAAAASSEADGKKQKKKVSKKTIAYAVSPVTQGDPQVAQAPGGQQAPAPQPVQPQASQPLPQQAVQPAAPQPAAPQPASQPPPPQSAAPRSAPASERPVRPSAPPAPLASIGEWSLLSERSETPTAESPLHYRERTFVVPDGTSKARAEAILRERLTESQAELADEPPGKYLNFAVFDHSWSDRPKRPPIVQIQWKDWRGDLEVSYPLEAKLAARAQRAASQPPAAAPPAPAPLASPAPPATDEHRPPVARGKRTTTDEQDARLAHAFEATQDLFFLSTPAEGLDFAIRLLDELVPSEAATACLYDINTDEFRFVALSGPGAEERKGEAIPARTGLLGTAAERVGAAYIVPDVSGDTLFDPGVDGRVGLEPRNALYMSIHHQGRLLGILQLVNRRDRPAYSTADSELVAYIAKQLAEFLFQARIAPDQGARI